MQREAIDRVSEAFSVLELSTEATSLQLTLKNGRNMGQPGSKKENMRAHKKQTLTSPIYLVVGQVLA
jgi:hypothetical protein